jgi:hypothetical protein
MNNDLLVAVNDLTDQIKLLREDLRPELKKAAIFRKKNAQAQRIKEDSQNYIPKRHR